MNFINLGSSSSGNCYYIELDRKDLPPTKLLVEVGLPYMEIVKRATKQGINLTEINAILVTHGHMDHAKSCKDFIKKRKNLFANEQIITKNFGKVENILKENEEKVIAFDTKVFSFCVEHDAENSLGFVITTSKEKILFVNDCKFFKADVTQIPFDYIFIESNYDGQILHFAYEEAKKNNDVPNIKRYERLFDSHMSLSHTIKHLQRMNLNKCKAIFLMHLSDRHANENKFKIMVKNAVNKPVFVCKKNGGIL